MTHDSKPTAPQATTFDERLLAETDLPALTEALRRLRGADAVAVLERLGDRDRAIVYRMLPKDTALEVFEALDVTLQGHLVQALKAEDVAEVFAELDPDDRVSLLDELPALVATRLLQGLPVAERDLTSVVLGYPQGSIGRRMSPEYVSTRPDLTVAETLSRVQGRLGDAETVYSLPVTDATRHVVGMVSLRDLMGADDQTRVAELMHPAHTVHASEDAETAARRCADLRLLALPVVDAEGRAVGVVTVDDALDILEDADSKDQARIGGSEPLRRPYLSTPVRSIVRSRVVWLLVLAVGATLTVQVLEVFEQTLEEMVVLSLFIPLLIGTGGNTGNQAATTLTRALALDDVRPRDILRPGGVLEPVHHHLRRRNRTDRLLPHRPSHPRPLNPSCRPTTSPAWGTTGVPGVYEEYRAAGTAPSTADTKNATAAPSRWSAHCDSTPAAARRPAPARSRLPPAP